MKESSQSTAVSPSPHQNIHLFILCPPASGSTLLQHLLMTSPTVSGFKAEGQALAKEELFTSDRWNPRKEINWDKVKAIWNANWNTEKPVLLEKSPPHLVRALQIETVFPNCRFIIMIRNPYAFCEGVKRRWGRHFTYYNIARFWAECAWWQRKNIEQLKQVVSIRYEDLGTRPKETSQFLLKAIPELHHLGPGQSFQVFGQSSPIQDRNPKQISRLLPPDIFEINMALKNERDLMSYFAYDFIDPSPMPVVLRVFSKIRIRISSFHREPKHIARIDS